MVNFPTHIPSCDSHSPVLLNLFISSDARICSTMTFPPFADSDHSVVSVSTDFPSSSQWNVLSHCIAYDYSCADWDGLRDPLRDVKTLKFLKDLYGLFCLFISALVSSFIEIFATGMLKLIKTKNILVRQSLKTKDMLICLRYKAYRDKLNHLVRKNPWYKVTLIDIQFSKI